MSNTIGYGAAAIRAGDVKYQQAMVEMLKKSAQTPEKANSKADADKIAAEQTAKHRAADSGHAVDVKA